MSETSKQPCPKCREKGEDTSGDNLVNFGEGRGAHCFACGYHVHGGDAEKREAGKDLKRPLKGQIRSLKHRHVDQRTCSLFDYRLAKVNGEIVEVANYYLDGKIVAQHTRGAKKQFRWAGNTNNLPLFGQWLWSGKGRRIVVTEGEIDCLSVSMLWQNRWPVVSLPNGIQSGEKFIRLNAEFLSGYDEIVLCFDNDEAGRVGAEKCAEILPPGKVRIARTALKDANEHVMRGETKTLMTAIYEARTYQPDGILHVSDITDGDAPVQRMWSFPWSNLTKGLMGQRSGEITLWASGTGSGKSSVMREMAYHHILRGRRVGMLMLEESPLETLDDLIALKLNKAVRQIRASRILNTLLIDEGGEALDFGFADNLTDEEYDEARKFFSNTSLYIYDHHGTNEFASVLQRVEYMAASLECDIVIIDHVTALVAGLARNGSERESIDEIMRQLRSIVERTGVHIDIVSQLNRLDGKAAEEGAQISLKNLRGSGSLGSVPNNVIAIERNQQAEDPEERNIVKVRILKGRFIGDTGVVGHLKFNKQTRRLDEAEWTKPGSEQEIEDVGSTLTADEILPEEGDSPVTSFDGVSGALAAG